MTFWKIKSKSSQVPNFKTNSVKNKTMNNKEFPKNYNKNSDEIKMKLKIT